MPGHVQVESLTVGEFLGGDRQLTLPWFQRCYAWGERQVGRLLADLRGAMAADSGRNRYFLGHIYLARPPGQAVDELIDGNQRITTLTILFSILRDLADGEEAMSLNSHVLMRRPAGNSPMLRLNPQPSVAPFLERYVQTPGSTHSDVEEDLIALTHTERAIFNNREDIKSLLSQLTARERADVASFVRDRCCLTVSTVDDADEAWDMLTTVEETGLRHHDTDRAKHSLLSPMPRGDQLEAARVWDIWVAKIGPDRAQELLGHIRTIRSNRRSTKPIEEDLVRMYRLDQSGIAFLNDEFAPRAALLERILKRQIGAGTDGDAIATHIDTLLWLEHPLWIAPALRWLETRGDTSGETRRFFFALDRLSWLLRLSGADPIVQERRFIEVCDALRQAGPVDTLVPLAAEQKLIDLAVSNLRSRTFEVKRYSDLVLRRVSLELGQDPGPLEPDNLTIEHVLPRNPSAGSDWWRHFRSRTQVSEYTNRLGNLTFLTRAENQLASTKDYEMKRRILAGSELLLARDAAEAPEWTPETIRARTERLVAVLLGAWQL